MEMEELQNRVDWLEGEHRKDKQLIMELTDKIAGLSDEIVKSKTKIRAVETDSKKFSQNSLRKQEFDEAISTQKMETQQQFQELEKKITTHEKKADKQRKDDQNELNKRLLEMQNEIKPIGEIKKSIQSRIDMDYQTNQKIDEVNKQLSEYRATNDDLLKGWKSIEDNYRLETKKSNDLQVEISTLRKKLDEEQIVTESQKEFVRKLEGRINELLNQEQLRKQEQLVFIENQSRYSVDRENIWKEWQTRLDQLDQMGSNLQAQLLDLDNTHRAVRKAQTDFEEINLRLDRRINEITEMNRLAEERFRQEWISFKADDQKRWTNYSLSHEEESREANRGISKLVERLTTLEDTTQDLIDTVNIINDETEKRIKAILSLSNDLLSSFEKTLAKRM